jgi:hypothetical protein
VSLKRPVRTYNPGRLLLVALLLCTLVIQSHPADVSASSIKYKGITLTPAIVNLDLQPGQSRASFDIEVTNNTNSSQSLAMSSLDFKSLNETGGVAFIGSKASQVDHKYGLASWLNLGTHNVELAPGQTKTASITVENRSDLSAGGHYAAVLFKSTNDGSTGNRANQVAINEVVSTLVFVRKLEGAKYGISLEQLSVPSGWLRMPSSLNVVFKNTGNTQLTPRGILTVSGPLSPEVSRGIINPDSSLVLPESSRLYQTSLIRTGHAWWPGVYHATVQYRYDGTSDVQTATTSFFYASPVFIALLLVGIAVIWCAIRWRKSLQRSLSYFRLRKRS